MRAILGADQRGPVVSGAVALFGLAIVALTVVAGVAVTVTAPAMALAVTLAVAHRWLLSWPVLLAGLVLVIVFIPIKRYTIPGDLPFELEPYRIYVGLIAAMWLTALLIDRRVRLRASGIEAPLFLFVSAALASVIFNSARIDELGVHTEVTKDLTFFASFVVVFYLIVSVVRTREQVDLILKVLVASGSVVAVFAIVESHTGFNVFAQLHRVLPLLEPHVADAGLEPISRGGKVRVFGSAQGPIALGAAFAMLLPLGVYVGIRTRQVRWWVAVSLLALGALATLSRTSILMCIVILVMAMRLRPQQVKRFWPVLLPGVVLVHFLLPGTLGALKGSFFPEGGLIAQQSQREGSRGSGRIADLGPALDEFSYTPVFGQGLGTRLTGREAQIHEKDTAILDDQWLKTLLETGLVGAFAWLWIFVRSVKRLSRAARADDSDGGYLYVALACSITAFAFGMFLYDAFSFIQVTFLLFIVMALGSAAVASLDGRHERARLRSAPTQA